MLVTDVIVGLDGTAVNSPADVARVIRSKKPGEKIKVDVVRDAKKQSLEATLGQR